MDSFLTSLAHLKKLHLYCGFTSSLSLSAFPLSYPGPTGLHRKQRTFVNISVVKRQTWYEPRTNVKLLSLVRTGLVHSKLLRRFPMNHTQWGYERSHDHRPRRGRGFI